MQALFAWLAANPFVLLFTVVLGAVLVGRMRLGGIGLGIAGSAILVGATVSALAAAHDVRLAIDPAVRSLFLCLFMYGLGLRLGPSVPGALRRDGLRYSGLAFLTCTLGLALAFATVVALDLPAGAVAGVLAGSMTLTAAVGAAEQAIQHGVFALPAGAHADQVRAMVALSYSLTYAWGAIGFALLCKYVPQWWGTDLKSAARRHEEVLGVPQIDEAGITSLRPLAVRAHRLSSDTLTGWTLGQFRLKYSHLKVLNVLRSEPVRRESALLDAAPPVEAESLALAAIGVQSITRLREPDGALRARREPVQLRDASYVRLGAGDELALRQGDIVALGGTPEALANAVDLVGPEVTDPTALNVPLDQAEIVVTSAAIEGRELGELRVADFAGQVALHHIERGGVPIPLGLHVRLQRMDVLFVTGVKSAVDKLAAVAGRVARPCASTELLTLSTGIVLGLLIGALAIPLGPGASVGLGPAGGLLVAGLLMSSIAGTTRLLGQTPKGARSLIEGLGLAAFAGIVAIDAGQALATMPDSGLAARVLLAGFVVCLAPPLVAWAVGHHWFRLNPAVLIGAVAGARAQESAARSCAGAIGSSVPWVGFPVAYAASCILLTLFGYVAMSAW